MYGIEGTIRSEADYRAERVREAWSPRRRSTGRPGLGRRWRSILREADRTQ